jgi:hypothetical protein
MGTFLRHAALCALPLAFAYGAGHGFTRYQGSCGAMVGALFAAKCRGVQQQYRLRFQLAGGGLGVLISATLGTWLELRRRRAVQPATPAGETS